MEFTETEAALEAILFASGDPISVSRLSDALGADEREVEAAAVRLADYYKFNRRGVRLVRLEDKYQMVTAIEYSEKIRRALESRRPQPISPAAMEVLSLVAYYQPVTRAFIEQIRGVDSSGTVATLFERGLIEECGNLDVPGRPRLFRTTTNFLRAFGISSLEELPKLQEFDEVEEGQLSIADLREEEGA